MKISARSTADRSFQTDETHALKLDARDPLRKFRDKFNIPTHKGKPVVYLCGHSLGLQPKAARKMAEQELDDWAALGVKGHFEAKSPWYPYHEMFRETGARLVGAKPGEVVMMNSLTVNLHLMLYSFYQPKGERRKILMEEPAFPSDLYAIKSHLRGHGLDPARDLILMSPRPGQNIVEPEDIEARLAGEGEKIAVMLLSGVNFLTGQLLPIERLSAAARRHGCIAGWDLAHAAGNVPLSLHDWDVDFAVWCSYKYLNSGPGAVGGCFVHERHGKDPSLNRLAGWWGHDPRTRFRLQLERDFIPQPGAEGWQISNPPILSLAPLKASLALFDEAGMPALRAKSEKLTAYLEFLLKDAPNLRIITPEGPAQRGCQLSILIENNAKKIHQSL